MKYFLGIDGGGTKTAYLLKDENEKTRYQMETAGSSYRENGLDETLLSLEENVNKCIAEAGIKRTALGGIAVGLPCYGEANKEDQLLEKGLNKICKDIPYYLTNDVEVGWAGSLNLSAGINVVAGTGSIAFGKNDNGDTARSGGWSTFFGDEGSCYWLGRRTMELFSKQADERIKKGSLYTIVRQEFGITDDMEFITCMDDGYIADRSKTASLQRVLLKSAQEGDESAYSLYQEAGEELFLLVEGCAKQLFMERSDFLVSYSGGLFHASKFVLPYFKERVESIGGRLTKPKYTPVEGAVLLAKEIKR